MSDGPLEPPAPVPPTPVPPTPAPTPAPTPTPTTVVGYPGMTPPSANAPYANPGMASLRGQLRTVRLLLSVCLAMLIVVVAVLGITFVTSRAQLDELSAQVDELSQQRVVASAPAESGGAQEAAVQQLGAATALPAETPLPSGVDPAGAVLIGDPAATDVVEVYVDYQCPYCQRWEAQIGTALAERALQPGSGLLVKQYNLAFLGETSPTLQPAGASARAASAAACVLNADGVEVFAAFNRAVFAAADPAEPPTQFSAEALTELAGGAGASDAAVACIEKEENVPFVAATTQAGFGRGVGGTPTVILNGRTLGNPFTDPALLALGTAS